MHPTTPPPPACRRELRLTPVCWLACFSLPLYSCCQTNCTQDGVKGHTCCHLRRKQRKEQQRQPAPSAAVAPAAKARPEAAVSPAPVRPSAGSPLLVSVPPSLCAPVFPPVVRPMASSSEAPGVQGQCCVTAVEVCAAPRPRPTLARAAGLPPHPSPLSHTCYPAPPPTHHAPAHVHCTLAPSWCCIVTPSCVHPRMCVHARAVQVVPVVASSASARRKRARSSSDDMSLEEAASGGASPRLLDPSVLDDADLGLGLGLDADSWCLFKALCLPAAFTSPAVGPTPVAATPAGLTVHNVAGSVRRAGSARVSVPVPVQLASSWSLLTDDQLLPL